MHASPTQEVEIVQGWDFVVWGCAHMAQVGCWALHSLGWWLYTWQLLYWEVGFQE
jgi:hypothetical protein